MRFKNLSFHGREGGQLLSGLCLDRDLKDRIQMREIYPGGPEVEMLLASASICRDDKTKERFEKYLIDFVGPAGKILTPLILCFSNTLQGETGFRRIQTLF